MQDRNVREESDQGSVIRGIPRGFREESIPDYGQRAIYANFSLCQGGICQPNRVKSPAILERRIRLTPRDQVYILLPIKSNLESTKVHSNDYDNRRYGPAHHDCGFNSEALLVHGDSPQDLVRPVYSVTSAELIQAPKRAEPGLRLYAVFDPYRRGLRAGIEIACEKITAGASGPFYSAVLRPALSGGLRRRPARDPDLLRGVSPVLSAAIRRYWDVKNHALFPRLASSQR